MTSPEDEQHKVVREYDEVANRADALMDKALNATMAWLAVDPNRNIQRDREKRERESADVVRHLGSQSTHQVREDIELKKIEEIFDSNERNKALIYYMARKKAHAERKREGR